MKLLCLLICPLLIMSCKQNTGTAGAGTLPLQGSWQLVTGITITGKDSTITDYTQKRSFIKIINNTHFAFLQHDLAGGKDSANASFTAGGGKYQLSDSTYTEHLEYCSDRQWENHDFTFTISIRNDTLVQQGVEKVESAGVNRINIEKYVRIQPVPAAK